LLENVKWGLALILFVVSGKNVSKRFFSETIRTVETKLPRNDHWKVLYKYLFFMAIGIPRWPPPQDIY
jgi:hypothetical protein